jgi:hypothetical protein
VIVIYEKPTTKIYVKSNELKLEDVNKLRSVNVDDLTSAEIKMYLKEFGFNLNWSKSQLKKKLTKLLIEKRDSLLKTLQTNDSKTPKCPKCSSEMKRFHDLKQLIEFDARYAAGFFCDKCKRESKESENLFPMIHCLTGTCCHNECKSCVREVNGRRKIGKVVEKQTKKLVVEQISKVVDESFLPQKLKDAPF